jgi:forespore regulator of the sigma-K checkpoint
MMIFKMLKQLKKKLRRKLKWISFGIAVVIVVPFILNWSVFDKVQSVFGPAMNLETLSEQNQAIVKELKQSEQSREVFLQKRYVCGEEMQRIGELTPNEIAELSKEHSTWELTLQADGQVYLTEHIQDLSESCKEAAYFGVDENGVLSLFDGIPQQNKVIQSFFQLNIQYLKSALPPDTVAQLYVGIRVSDIDEYNSVLSTFADYARAGAEHTMGTPNTAN